MLALLLLLLSGGSGISSQIDKWPIHKLARQPQANENSATRQP